MCIGDRGGTNYYKVLIALQLPDALVVFLTDGGPNQGQGWEFEANTLVKTVRSVTAALLSKVAASPGNHSSKKSARAVNSSLDCSEFSSHILLPSQNTYQRQYQQRHVHRFSKRRSVLLNSPDHAADAFYC